MISQVNFKLLPIYKREQDVMGVSYQIMGDFTNAETASAMDQVSTVQVSGMSVASVSLTDSLSTATTQPPTSSAAHVRASLLLMLVVVLAFL